MAAGVEIVAEGLRKSYRHRVVLEVPAFVARSGETTVVLGPSGAGKSTLLALVGLLERPDTGEIRFGGRPVSTRDHAARLLGAAVFQRPFLFKGTVADNVAYGLKLRGVPGAERASRVHGALERVGLDGFGERSVLTLSGGEAHRVALARALVLEPRFLLLDEPLASLDPLLKRRLAAEFAEIFRREGTTVVYVTHDQDEAMTVADRLVIMNEGRVAAVGAAEEVMGLPEDEWAAGFIGMEPAVRGVVASSEDGLARIDCDGCAIFAVSDAEPGVEVLAGVRPEDVMLFEDGTDIPHSSARNRVRMRVAALEPRGGTVRVVLEAGSLRLAALVSRAAAADLALAPGTEVLALFKATAVRVRLVGRAPASPQV